MLKKFAPKKAINLTDLAASRVQKLLADKAVDQRFRIYVTGGGCSGFEYGFMFDAPQQDDLVVTTKGTEVIVDALSIQYLKGATVDFISDLSGSKFSVQNPNVSTTCSCGLSFSI